MDRSQELSPSATPKYSTNKRDQEHDNESTANRSRGEDGDEEKA
jgi:hypothetical protein